jgi:hypothetical protein
MGPFFNEESQAVATLGAAKFVPVMSSTASLSELSDKVRYPYFIRSRSTNDAPVSK